MLAAMVWMMVFLIFTGPFRQSGSLRGVDLADFRYL